MPMPPRAFVAMPFGTKTGPDGQTPIDFNAIWDGLLQPALAAAGYEPCVARLERRAGDIREDMFQELLAADLVLADLTIPNPNVWYELGVRHALRARGVVLTYGMLPGIDAPKAFDVYTDRKLGYPLQADGTLPSDDRLKDAVQALTAMVVETRKASTRRKISPVYALLPHLQEPKWRDLLMDGQNEVSDRYRTWRERLNTARRRGLAGDVMVLADETPVRALAVEGHCAAGDALLDLMQPELALEQFDEALTIDPLHLPARRKRLVALGRCGRLNEARSLADSLLDDHADDPECRALFGRLEKMRWVARWCPEVSAASGLPLNPIAAAGAGAAHAAEAAVTQALHEQARARWRAAAQDECELLDCAIEPYREGFARDPRHFYSGVNALTLLQLHHHLDPLPADRLAVLEDLAAAVKRSVDSSTRAQPQDYWALASAAEVATLRDDEKTARQLWKKALASPQANWFAVDASRQTLQLMQVLGFRPEVTGGALAVVEDALSHLQPPFVPRQVFLFTGHMMDAPGRNPPRFPPSKEAAAAARIAQALDDWGAGPEDIAYSQAAAGGDLLYLEACRQRGVRIQVLLPFDEGDFLLRSVDPSAQREGAPSWRQRWNALKPALAWPARSMAAELGPTPESDNPYERCNLWLLSSALAHGPDKLRFIALWNGQSGDGPGGTSHLKAEAERRTSQVCWIDTRTL